MIAKREIWKYSDKSKVWVGKYQNSNNLVHWHYDCELVYVERGEVEISCEKSRYTLKRGEAMFVDSGQMHSQKATEDTVLYMVVFDHALTTPFFSKVQLACPKLTQACDIPALYTELRRILLKKAPFYETEASAKLSLFLVETFRKEQLVKRVERDKTTRAFQNLLVQMSERFSEFTFDEAVKMMGMSDAYFSRYFKGMTGFTFSQYLNYLRTDHAVRLLLTEKELPMTEIALRCGFTTIRNFNRIFKETTGYAPSRLPADYTPEERLNTPSDEQFNPSLHGCELLESSEGE